MIKKKIYTYFILYTDIAFESVPALMILKNNR